MKKNAILSCAGLLLTSALLLTGCGSKTAEKNTRAAIHSEVSIKEAVADADPRGAAEAIYEAMENNQAQELDAKGLLDYYTITAAEVSSFVVFRTDAKNGLCDLAIISPASGTRDKIRDALYLYKERRMEEFRNYDILDAFTIAQNAVVLDQGDYVVLLMLPDNETAQELLDSYIPQ